MDNKKPVSRLKKMAPNKAGAVFSGTSINPPKTIKAPKVKNSSFVPEENQKEWKTDNPYKLGVAYLKNNNYELAAKALKENLKKDTDCSISRYGLGIAYLQMEKYAEAITEFKQVLINEPDNSEARVSLGTAYLKLEKFESGIKEFSILLKQNDNEENKRKLAFAYYLLANKLFKNNNINEALNNYNNAAEYDKNNAVVAHKLGFCYHTLKNYPKAIECFENALENVKDEEKRLEIYNLLIEAKIFNGDDEDALVLCNQSLIMFPFNAMTNFLIGEIYFHKNEYENALNKYVEASKYDPKFIQALMNSGHIYVIKNYLNKALAVYAKVLELTPDNPTALCNIALIKYKQGDKNAAFNILFKLAVKGGEKNYLVHKYLGIIWLEKGKAHDAIVSLKKAVELNNKDIDNHINLGVCFHKTNVLNTGAEHYLKALDIEPQNMIALKNLALLYFDWGKNHEAIELYEKLLDLEPENMPAIKNIGHSYRKIGGLSKAIEHYNSYIRINDKDPEIHLNLGITYFETDDFTNAHEAFKTLLKLGKKYLPISYCYLSKIYEKSEEYNYALDFARKAVHIDGKYAEGFVQYGKMSLKSGKKNKAISYLEKALALEPRHKEAKTLLDELLPAKEIIYEELENMVSEEMNQEDEIKTPEEQCDGQEHEETVEDEEDFTDFD